MVLSRTQRALARTLPAALAATLSAGLVPATAAAAGPPAPTLHYAFDTDDVATGVVTDSSGHGLNGTLVNGATATMVTGADGGTALNLPGGAPTSDGAYVRIPREALSSAPDLTVSARLKWDNTNAGAWQWIYALGRDTTKYLFSTPSNGDGNLRTAATTAGGGAEAQVTGYGALPAAAWKTVTVTLDSAAHRLTTYLDGTAVASTPTNLTAAQIIDSTATSAGYIGKSFYPDPLFKGAIDDFQVFDSALSADQVAQLTGGRAPTAVTPARTTFDLRTAVGTAPALPPAVRSTFSDGYDRDVPIAWQAVDPAAYGAPGDFTVTGSAGGIPVTANVRVIRPGQLTIDLGTGTGAFHGGASGSLYGLYGDGVPTNNLIEGMHVRTISTKAQDGPQHPGADALEVVKPLADSSNGDVYIYMTDIHRGFPYQWPGSTPEEKMRLYSEKIAKQVEQVRTLDPKYQDNIVFVPFNEPEGNMFGTGEWSYDRVSWRTDPTAYFAAWDQTYRLIKGILPNARIAGPNTSVLYPEVKGFLQHTVAAGTVPQVVTWHELSHPEQVRSSVAQYRAWEKEVFAGTAYAGRQLPVNVNEYAFNYHTSVPGQMIQWISAIEDSKIDADIAYWNIDGNLSDSAVQANRGNGQWWLYNAYGEMSGHTVHVDPPFPGVNYSLQGVATLDESKAQARAIFGGADGPAWIQFDKVPPGLGSSVHAWIREIPWTGQIGDSAQPELITERNVAVKDGRVAFDFGGSLPSLKESSAYEIVLSPAGKSPSAAAPPKLVDQSYEAENATYTGSGYTKNGPEGSPQAVSKFYTSGGYDVGGLRTGSDGVLGFTVDVPQDGTYDLSVFANSLNTADLIKDRGPTNVFVRVDGANEQEILLPLGYKWVVWDHTDTKVRLSKGKHVISLAARSLDGTRTTKGDAIVDRIKLALPNPAAATSVYEAELATLKGGKAVYGTGSGPGSAELGKGAQATFWVYSPADAESTITVRGTLGSVTAVAVNGREVRRVAGSGSVAVSLSGGVNKVTLTGVAPKSVIDRIDVRRTDGTLVPEVYEAEAAQRSGSVQVTALPNAGGGQAVTGVGGAPGNDNALTFRVTAAKDGTYAMRIRYSNPEQAVATHYNPDPVARHADVSVNGGAAQRVLFPHSFHQDNFWELTVPVQLKAGANTITFRSGELPNFDGTTYASDTFPGVALRSQWAPVLDRIAIAPFSAPAR
ncbi:CBM35 domain-containing protein [Amycolatopsis mongoliensis]|uniref:CBM35 domain-containing protein n=1 Tax=Amycolatopsis mongoliensis TaxID=715475 RepID=A0A9Y2JHU9_9PSEU|nr:LamG-like jellyroll fold domain-containing protein [Amycolatopsis sp. 4-36]WIX98804.1 CBM35 domain-containing protein [Amycolatopsis sp. 4-36]